jgi:hypothetical protein
MVGFALLGLMQALLASDTAAMTRQLVARLPMAVVGMAATTVVVARLLELTDALSNAVLSSSGTDLARFGSGFGVAAAGVAGFAAVVVGLLAALAALLLWIELIVRASLVYVLVAVTPLGFAATLWPAARGVLRRTVELLLAVILSKLVIAIAIAVGAAALAGAGDAGSTSAVASASAGSFRTLLVGAVVLGLAAFSPFIVLRLIPVAEAALVAQGISRGPARGAQSGISTISSVQAVGRIAGGSGAGRARSSPTQAAVASGVATGGVATPVAAAASAASSVPARVAGAVSTADSRSAVRPPSAAASTLDAPTEGGRR